MITVKKGNIERLVASKEAAAKWLAVGYEIVNHGEPVKKKAPSPPPKDKKGGGKSDKSEKPENPNAEKATKDGASDGADGVAQAVMQSGA